MVLARDIMIRHPYCVAPYHSLSHAAQVMREHGVEGLPVADDDQCVVGMVTETDLFRKKGGLPFSLVRMPDLMVEWHMPRRLVEAYAVAGARCVSEVMSAPPVTVEETEPAVQIARVMVERNIKRVPITCDGRLVGVVTRMELLRLLAGEAGGGR
jgi:CBS domain-containing protein